MPERYKNVSIQFLTPGQDTLDVRAEVRREESQMVISIPDQPFSDAYLVHGKKVEHFFAGVDSLKHEAPVRVAARWTLLGDVYVGIWIEEGIEYLFSFRIPRSRITRRRS